MLSSAVSSPNYVSLNTAWKTLLLQLVTQGREVAPRGQLTREVVGNRIVFDATRPVVTVAERKLGYRFLCAEAAWIMDGDSRVATIAPYSKEISRFSDDGVNFFGAYGPPIQDQLLHVKNSLLRDRSSRQAVITIWRQNPPATKDVPCTVSLQWVVREMDLHCIASMRSSDAWLGVPYDGFNFSMLTLGLLLELRRSSTDFADTGLGTVTMQLGSSHLYEQNFEGALTCAASRSYRFGSSDGLAVPVSFLGEINSWPALKEHLWALARRDAIKPAALFAELAAP